jgi:hypothetical protein
MSTGTGSLIPISFVLHPDLFCVTSCNITFMEILLESVLRWKWFLAKIMTVTVKLFFYE